MCVYTQLCQHTSVCVCVFLENKIKALVMHKIWAQNAPYTTAEHKLFIMLVQCEKGWGGVGGCAWIQSSYTTSLF